MDSAAAAVYRPGSGPWGRPPTGRGDVGAKDYGVGDWLGIILKIGLALVIVAVLLLAIVVAVIWIRGALALQS